MAGGALAGKVVVVPVGGVGGVDADRLARTLAAAGATVVLVATGDARVEAGRLASDIQAEGAGRPAVFVLDQDGEADPLDALVEFVAELFPASG